MSKKATWSELDLKAAMKAVKNGKGKRASARNFGEFIFQIFIEK